MTDSSVPPARIAIDPDLQDPHPTREAAVQYAFAIALVVAAHVISSLLWNTLESASHMVFLGAVIIAAVNGGYGPSLLATGLATLDIAYTFMKPYGSLVINFEDLMFLVTFTAIALITSSLQARRRSAEASLRRAHDELERRVRDRTAELMRSEAKLGLLVNDLLVIAEHEQQRIGYDLHDGLGQELTGISMLGVALTEELRSATSPSVHHAEQMADLLQGALRHTRDLARGLCPVDLADEGLAAALSRLAERVSRVPGVTCTFDAVGDPTLPEVTATHLFRIAQEAISNALRHGQARNIAVSLNTEGTALSLTITDDGPGFAADAPAGMGLRLMHHRAETIGGVLEVAPAATGTRVRCELSLS